MLDSQTDESLPPPHSLTFEKAFTRLSAMVETLETGNLPLDEAARMFEQGMALVRRCGQLLDETELRIAEIRENASASPPAGSPTGATGSTAPASAEGLPWGDLEMPPLDDEWEPQEDLPNGD